MKSRKVSRTKLDSWRWLIIVRYLLEIVIVANKVTWMQITRSYLYLMYRKKQWPFGKIKLSPYNIPRIFWKVKVNLEITNKINWNRLLQQLQLNKAPCANWFLCSKPVNPGRIIWSPKLPGKIKSTLRDGLIPIRNLYFGQQVAYKTNFLQKFE